LRARGIDFGETFRKMRSCERLAAKRSRLLNLFACAQNSPAVVNRASVLPSELRGEVLALTEQSSWRPQAGTVATLPMGSGEAAAPRVWFAALSNNGFCFALRIFKCRPFAGRFDAATFELLSRSAPAAARRPVDVADT
jgi:hypothetical protein